MAPAEALEKFPHLAGLEAFTLDVDEATAKWGVKVHRFEIKVDFATPQGSSGAAGAVKLADDSGYVWFFDQNNVEAVFKVLDGCFINQNYWFL